MTIQNLDFFLSQFVFFVDKQMSGMICEEKKYFMKKIKKTREEEKKLVNKRKKYMGKNIGQFLLGDCIFVLTN